jgi:hypothetical protein
MKMKPRLKGCPRCGGDLFPDLSDPDQQVLTCLQCGAMRIVRTAPPQRQPAAPR